jgi:hypothetical protein
LQWQDVVFEQIHHHPFELVLYNSSRHNEIESEKWMERLEQGDMKQAGRQTGSEQGRHVGCTYVTVLSGMSNLATIYFHSFRLDISFISI